MIYYKNFDFGKLSNLPTKKSNDISCINAPFSFDIETSSFYDNGTKRATMYIFMFSLNGDIIFGRTWAECTECFEKLIDVMQLSPEKRAIIYIHNLAYEFQFMCGHFKMADVFARDPHHPIRATIFNCIDLKCSYYLSGVSLDKLATTLVNVEIKKQVGSLDYKLLRHSNTPLTETELKYCEYDVKILHYFILQEMQKNNNDITQIPLTKTGYVRKYLRKYIRKQKQYGKHRNLICKIAPTDPELFILLHKSFAGGYTHANCAFVYDIINNVASIDFTSSYPAQMCRHLYPMTQFIKMRVNGREDFRRLIDKRACVFEIAIKNVRAKTNWHILSASKCAVLRNEIIDNGRIVRADELITYMTDVDFRDFEQFYDYDGICVSTLYTAIYKPLPKPLLECVLEFYRDKTGLKNVDDKKLEYGLKKEMLNSMYGACVTNPLNDEITYNADLHEWGIKRGDIANLLNDTYIRNKKTMLVYQWGVWITAWARHELYRGLLEINTDAIYSDTDSIKFRNYNNHKKWIEKYNRETIAEIRANLSAVGIDPSQAQPKTIGGKIKPLGVWDYEGEYEQFKTLGAKRYCFTKNGKFNITVSGLNKNVAAPYIWEHGGFEFFGEHMYIPPEHTGKMTHTYIDDKYTATITDYLGNTSKISENTYIHLEQQEYSLTLSAQFTAFLNMNDYIFGRKNSGVLTGKRPELAINEFETI